MLKVVLICFILDCGVAGEKKISYPWNALIEVTLVEPKHESPEEGNTTEKDEAHVHFCSGSVINDLFILTAANCVYNSLNPPTVFDLWDNEKFETKPENVRVWLKVKNKHTKGKGAEVREVAKIFYHYRFPIARIRHKLVLFLITTSN